jgi:predicted RNase H-related nuclease YkuK (DUF458 family)
MTPSSPGAAVFWRIQNEQQGRDFEARLRDEAKLSTYANRFRTLAQAAAENAIQHRLAVLNSQTR